jgi:hypothetical protein
VTEFSPPLMDNSVRDLRKLSLLLLVDAVVFFLLIFNPMVFEFFDQEASDASRLTYVQGNLNLLRVLFTGIGVTELALGVALWLWGRRVRRQTTGGRGTAANAFAWVGLVAGVLAVAGRSAVWFEDAEQIASSELGFVDRILFLPASVGFSLSFIVFGVLMVIGAMPTWLGVVWIVCGILFWVGILPLWFFVGALVFGVWGVIRFPPGRGSVAQIAAVRTG